MRWIAIPGKFHIVIQPSLGIASLLSLVAGIHALSCSSSVAWSISPPSSNSDEKRAHTGQVPTRKALNNPLR